MPVAALELQKAKGAQDFKAKHFKVHVDTGNGHTGLDGSARSTFVPLSDVRRLTADARIPQFLFGAPKGKPENDPMSRTHGYRPKPEDVYTQPYPAEGFDIAAKNESALSKMLTGLENTTISGIRREEWSVPGSSQSPERIKATIYNKDGSSWSVFREVTTETRGHNRDQISSIVNGSMISLIHTDAKGNIRKFTADNNPEGGVTYSEIKDGEEIKYYYGSHAINSNALASEFSQLDPKDVLLVKNEITSPERQKVWANSSAPAEDIDQLLANGRLKEQNSAQEIEIFDSTKATRPLVMTGSSRS
jgi:hypothetical protein